MTELLSDIDTPSDAELIARVRGGDVAAYGELFSRHVHAAKRLARQLDRGSDADDLVSDAFAKVLTVLQGGGGPDVAFRAYLLTAVRRLHVDRVRAGSRLQTSDDMTQFDPGIPFQDTAVTAFDNGAAAKAFASLPERWQLVLWHLEVEGQKPADIAPLLGMSANSVSALAYRAREGLRQAFLTMHLSDISAEQCRWVNEHLGAYVRNGLAKRDAAKVDEHLKECRRCTAMYLELTEVNSNLKGIIAPLLLGAAATGYLTSTGSAGTAGVLALLGRARDLVLANASVAATGAAAAGVAAVATTVVLVTHHGAPNTVTSADRPLSATTRVAPSAGAPAAPPPSAGPSSAASPSAGVTSPAAAATSPGALETPSGLPSTAPSGGTDTVPGSGPGSLPGTVPGTGPGSAPGAPGTAPASPPTSPAGQPSNPQPSHQPTPTHQPTPPQHSTPPPTHQPTPPPPTHQPTPPPTHQPTGGPTNQPTGGPTGNPTGGPTGQPTGQPTGRRTDQPSGEPSTPAGGGQTDQPTPPPPTTEPTGGDGGTVAAAFSPLAAPTAPPDELGRFVLPMEVTGLPDGTDRLTFTVSPVSNQMGLSQFTASTTAAFADTAPTAVTDSMQNGTGPSCSLSDSTTLVCAGLSGTNVKANFPVTLTPLEPTTVKITATGDGVTATSDPVTITPPSADIGLSNLTAERTDSGTYQVTGTVTGIPSGYQFLGQQPTYSLTSDNQDVVTTLQSASTTCPSDGGDCALGLVIAASGLTDATEVTVTASSLPGYIDSTAPGSGNSNTATVQLDAPAPPAKELVLQIIDTTPGSGADREVTVSVNGAGPEDELIFSLHRGDGADPNGKSVDFETLPDRCNWTDGTGDDRTSISCKADSAGALTNEHPWIVKVPSGQHPTMTVSDGTTTTKPQPLDPQTH